MKTAPALLLAMLACGASCARADVMTFGASQDTSIFANNVDNSDGGGPGIFAGTSGAGSPRRGLIAFDVSSIPAGATITNVQLTLTLGQTAGSGPGAATIGLFAVTQNWGQGTNGSTATGVGGTGQGFAANPGDATWNAAFFSATTPTLWNAPGGDHVSTASASRLVSGTTVGTAYTWGSTVQFVANVQSWLNNPATNFGLELVNADETNASTLYGFYSSEWDNTHFGGSATQVPALQVTYTVPVPEPTGISLAAIAAFTLLGRRRRSPLRV
jgi:hypothetical protein